MTTHPLQQEILRQLIITPSGKRYSEMRPSDIENDLYNYHLQQLVKLGLVQKVQNHYLLSEQGKKYILDYKPLDIANGTVDTFKLAAICLVIDTTDSEAKVLVQTRSIAPFAGNLELPGGSIYKGENVTNAAARRLTEETGLSANFSLFGIIRKMRYGQDKQLYSDILYHICLATQSHGTLISENEFGTKHWTDLEKYILHEQEASYGSPTLARHIQQTQATNFNEWSIFYCEETYTGNIY